jgi:hypothetical protein
MPLSRSVPTRVSLYLDAVFASTDHNMPHIAEIASLKSQLDRLKAANDSNTSPSTPTELVPRPIGSHGSQYNVGKELIKNYGVSKQEYNKMMVSLFFICIIHARC